MRRGRQRARRAPCDVRGQDGGQHDDDNVDDQTRQATCER